LPLIGLGPRLLNKSRVLKIAGVTRPPQSEKGTALMGKEKGKGGRESGMNLGSASIRLSFLNDAGEKVGPEKRGGRKKKKEVVKQREGEEEKGIDARKYFACSEVVFYLDTTDRGRKGVPEEGKEGGPGTPS